MTKDSSERVLSGMQPKYVTSEYCFILMSSYWMFSGFEFLILRLLQHKIDFVLSSPKWILIYYLSTIRKACWNFWLVLFQFRWYLYVEILSKCHQHIAVVYGHQLVAYHLNVTVKRVVIKWILEELHIGGFQESILNINFEFPIW